MLKYLPQSQQNRPDLYGDLEIWKVGPISGWKTVSIPKIRDKCLK